MVHHYIITSVATLISLAHFSLFCTQLASSSSGLFTVHIPIPTPEHPNAVGENHTIVLTSLTPHFTPRSQTDTQFCTIIIMFSWWILSPSSNRNFPYFLLSSNFHHHLPTTLSIGHWGKKKKKKKESDKSNLIFPSWNYQLGPNDYGFPSPLPLSFIEI